jgi:hypothetical protein
MQEFMKIFKRGRMMQEHRIKPKCMPKTKKIDRHADEIKYIFVKHCEFQNMKH